MNQLIDQYSDEIVQIFGEASAQLQTLPEELKEQALALLSRCYPLDRKDNEGPNMISYLLPYWVGETLGSSIELCRELAVGNVYGMLSFFLLDDVMDEKREVRRSLALSTLLNQRFLEAYQRCFSGNAQLWVCYHRYLAEWADAMYREADEPMDPRDPGRLARKAAPVKLCAAALLLQAGRAQEIRVMETATDLALAVLQLSDDWTDWQEDLPTASCNAFLVLLRENLQLEASEVLDESMVKRSIYREMALGEFSALASGYADQLSAMKDAPASLQIFSSSIAQSLQSKANEIRDRYDSLLNDGGFSVYLTING
ncbi:hypothetical protein [Paenibacillus sp. Soil750]|uniref:hypothetical protein n=1 Tax=Paenibacillus sp. Soil750 TaxID=1736398 RepID=UPI0006F35B7D|nr:hypothetical protein [Paenibacillus sp. Soil750]KRE58439.1 hypothetical protein ASL11_29260 [Paenibacillus sp. Soil750]